jgi:DNA-binding MarR family transcriptional regulator
VHDESFSRDFAGDGHDPVGDAADGLVAEPGFESTARDDAMVSTITHVPDSAAYLSDVAQRIERGDVIFSQCTAYKSRQLARKVMAHFEASIASLGIKGTQFALLGFVLRDGPMQPSALAQVMALSASTLSRNVQPLIAQGWLVMGEGIDARSRLLAITPEGKKLCNLAGKRWQAAQATLGAQVGAQQLAALHDLIDGALQKISDGVAS